MVFRNSIPASRVQGRKEEKSFSFHFTTNFQYY